jgi:phospholipase/carboxylesterase
VTSHHGQLAGYHYRFEAGKPDSRAAVLVLHGTGSDENDLPPLIHDIAPGLPVISPRGNVSEQGMNRFFRRFAEGVFDEADVKRRAAELSRFVEAAREEHALQDLPLVAVGYSNGANIAAAMLLQEGTVAQSAVLLRPMMPFTAIKPAALDGVRVLLVSGKHDPICPPPSARVLAQVLELARADVKHEWLEASHGLTHLDVDFVRQQLLT